MSLYMYKEKYTKYKNKYLELKKQIGGVYPSYYGPLDQPLVPLTDVEIISHLLNVRWSNWLTDHSYFVDGTNPIVITHGNYHLTMYPNEIAQMYGHITDERITDNDNPNKRFKLYFDSSHRVANYFSRSFALDTDSPADINQKLGLFYLFEDIWIRIFRIGNITDFNQIN